MTGAGFYDRALRASGVIAIVRQYLANRSGADIFE
jgi:hypothetical protein